MDESQCGLKGMKLCRILFLLRKGANCQLYNDSSSVVMTSAAKDNSSQAMFEHILMGKLGCLDPEIGSEGSQTFPLKCEFCSNEGIACLLSSWSYLAFPAAWQRWWAQCCSVSESWLIIWVGMLQTHGTHGDSTSLYVYPMLGIYADIIFQNFCLDLKSRRRRILL